MSSRDMAINIINQMDENQLDGFVKLFSPIISNIPNDDTIKAIEETEELLKSDTTEKFYSVKDLFEDLAS